MRNPLLTSLLLTLPVATATAQWHDGDLCVRFVSVGVSASYLRIDPLTGAATSIISGGYPHGGPGSATYDSFRDVMLVNVSLPPDNYALPRMFALQANGTATAIAGFGTYDFRGLCSVGDGRVFYQRVGTSEIHYLDAQDQDHVLLDANGTAALSFEYEHAIYDPASNALIATTSGWWSTHDCTPGACSIFRVPLSQDGSRVGGPITCTPIATDNQEIVSLDWLPGGHILLTMDSGTAPVFPGLLRSVDPVTLATSVFASPTVGDLDGAVWSPLLGCAVALDDGANVLKRFASGSGGTGSVLATSLPVSAVTSGYGPGENLWRVDRNGPYCHGSATPYGTGLAGKNGYVPSLGAVGCSSVNTPFTLSGTRAVGGALGLLAFGGGPGAVPLLGGSLLVDPLVATIFMQANGQTGVGGVGGITLPLLVTDPGMVGATLWCQAGFLDVDAVQGVSLSNGLQIVIG